MRKKTFNKKFWKRGNGEAMAFAVIAPLIILTLTAIVSAVQIGIMSQKLSYTVYACGRAAAVSEERASGVQRAYEIYDEIMGTDYTEDGYIPCEIEVLNNEAWGKGAYIKITVRHKIDVLLPFVPDSRTESIVMMIESGGSA